MVNSREFDVFTCRTIYVLDSVHNTASSSAKPLMTILDYNESEQKTDTLARLSIIYSIPDSNASTNSGVLSSTNA